MGTLDVFVWTAQVNGQFAADLSGLDRQESEQIQFDTETFPDICTIELRMVFL